MTIRETREARDCPPSVCPKPPLGSRLKDAESCHNCGKRNHLTKDCRYLGQTKCGVCNRFGHRTEDCHWAKELKRKGEMRAETSDRKGKRPRKKPRKEEMNQGEEIEEKNDDEHIVFALNEPSEITFDDLEEGQFFNFNEPDVNDSSESNPPYLL